MAFFNCGSPEAWTELKSILMTHSATSSSCNMCIRYLVQTYTRMTVKTNASLYI